MCVSNEPCRPEVYKLTVLAKSSFLDFRTIGRTPDRAGKFIFLLVHGGKAGEKEKRLK